MWRKKFKRGYGRARSYTRTIVKKSRGMSPKAKRKTMVIGALAFLFLFMMAPNFRRWVEDTFRKTFPRWVA